MPVPATGVMVMLPVVSPHCGWVAVSTGVAGVAGAAFISIGVPAVSQPLAFLTVMV